MIIWWRRIFTNNNNCYIVNCLLKLMLLRVSEHDAWSTDLGRSLVLTLLAKQTKLMADILRYVLNSGGRSRWIFGVVSVWYTECRFINSDVAPFVWTDSQWMALLAIFYNRRFSDTDIVIDKCYWYCVSKSALKQNKIYLLKKEKNYYYLMYIVKNVVCGIFIQYSIIECKYTFNLLKWSRAKFLYNIKWSQIQRYKFNQISRLI